LAQCELGKVSLSAITQAVPQPEKLSFEWTIAAHTISLDVVLVTNNMADFLPYQSAGLKLENRAGSVAPSL